MRRSRQLGLRLLRQCVYHATDAAAADSRAVSSLAGPSAVWAGPRLPPSGGRMPFQRSFLRPFSALPPHTEMTMPALSPTMTQGNLVKWLVKEGQEVAPGDVLAEIETDKATLSWENQDEGFIAKLLVPEGAQAVAVGQPVALLVDEAEAVPAFKDFSAGGAQAAAAAPAAAEAAPAAAAPAGGKGDAYYSALPPHAEMSMPALSPTMTQGNLVKWLVREGQEVAPGDVLAEVETDKATLSWENQDEGFVAKLLIPEGAQAVAVGQPVAVLVEEAEAVPKFADYVPRGAAGLGEGAAPEAEASAEAAAPAAPAVEANSRIGPAARLLLEESNLPLSAVHPTGPNHIITKGDVLAAIAAAAAGKQLGAAKAAAPKAPAAPKAAAAAPAAAPAPKAAAQAAAPAAPAPAAPAPPVPLGARKGRRGGTPYVDIPNSQMRKIIAQRLLESKQSIPHLYLSADVELSGVSALREALKQQGTKVSVNDCVIKAVAMALAEVPAANARWDPTAEEAVPYATVDVAVAVATPAGLITPIVKAANTKSVVQISAEVRELAGRARANKLQPDEFMGGSFTISNLGMFGVDKFFAIVNPPQACIMAVGGARSVATMAPGGGLAAQPQMTVTLSADQRVFDGEVAAQFLDAFKRHMAAPFNLFSQ